MTQTRSLFGVIQGHFSCVSDVKQRPSRRRVWALSGAVVDGGDVAHRVARSVPSERRALLGGVMDDAHVDGTRQRDFVVRRVVVPPAGTASSKVIRRDRRAVVPVEGFLRWLTDTERSRTRFARIPATCASSRTSPDHAGRRVVLGRIGTCPGRPKPRRSRTSGGGPAGAPRAVRAAGG